MIIMSIPLSRYCEPSRRICSRASRRHVPIVDTSNYYPGLRDPHIPELDAGQVESLWVSKQLGRPVIKAFNNILAYSLAELWPP